MLLSKLFNTVLEHKKKLMFIGFLFVLYRTIRYPLVQKCVINWFQNKYLVQYEKEELFKFVKQSSADTIKTFQMNILKQIHEFFKIDKQLDKYTAATEKAEKIEIWKRLAVLIFSEIGSILYANVIFSICLTFHFNVATACQFKNVEGKQADLNSTHFRFILTFVKTTLIRICAFVESKVTPVVSSILMKESFNYVKITTLLYSIEGAIVGNESDSPIHQMGEYFYGNVEFPIDPQNAELFNEMIRDARFYLNMKETATFAINTLSESFLKLMTHITKDPDFNDLEEHGLTFLKVVLKLNKAISSKSYEKMFNKCISPCKMEPLAANLFESFCG